MTTDTDALALGARLEQILAMAEDGNRDAVTTTAGLVRELVNGTALLDSIQRAVEEYEHPGRSDYARYAASRDRAHRNAEEVAAALSRFCPTCGSGPDNPCTRLTDKSEKARADVHAARRHAAPVIA